VPILAVTLCVMMDLIVASVMGGFLDEIRKAARGLFGDVIVTEESLAGFGYYDTWLDAEGNAHPGLLQALGELDEVAAATPIIETYGLARLSRKEQKGWTKGVNILGIQPLGYAAVTDFQSSLYYQDPGNEFGWKGPADFSKVPGPGGGEPVPLTAPSERMENPVGCILGVRVLWPRPDAEGQYPRGDLPPGFEPVQLTVAPIQLAGAPVSVESARTKTFMLVDTSHTNIMQIDQMACYVPFEVLQSLVDMDAADADEVFNGFRRPARCSRVLIKSAAGVPPKQCRDAVRRVVDAWKDKRLAAVLAAPEDRQEMMPYYEPFRLKPPFSRVVPGDRVHVRFAADSDAAGWQADVDAEGMLALPDVGRTVNAGGLDVGRLQLELRNIYAESGRTAFPLITDANRGVHVKIWEEANKQYFSAIENQKFIALLMVGVVSLTAVALIWVIFMMIVVEKTKDIGIIKSVGGSAVGVSMIFLIWAGLIGLIGTVLGGVLGTLFVSNIHGIEQFVSGLLNTQLWDPSAYLFDHIPARFKWSEMLILGVSSVLASMIGALLPAIRAGRMDPIEALRYE
jgi:ABC-type lipoprotein release transport system permease subunit